MTDRLMPRLPNLKQDQRPPKLSRLRKPVIHPLGPEYLGRRTAPALVAGPGPKPQAFTGTMDEFFFYFGMVKALNDPPDERWRNPPYYGGESWGYQIAVGGAYVRAPGSSVPDFVYYGQRGGGRVAIRIVTPYYHEGKGPKVQGYDILQIFTIESNGYHVVDVFSSDYMQDSTGQAAVIAAKQAIGLIQRTSTIRTARSTARG